MGLFTGSFKNSTLTIEQFKRLLKSLLFILATSAWSALEIFIIMRYINLHLYIFTFTLARSELV